MNMELVQILLPIEDNDGKPFPEDVLRRIQHELSDRFGGLTAYERAPAKGVWRHGESQHRDEVVILEVMVETVEVAWWRSFRARVEAELHQKELVIRSMPIKRL
ncbi:MAG TPA: hypothetical protein VMU22_12865 [Rhizomicrobium sp.]|nr:hypothetical protein [Rhizomicrobium sp.]